jgi:hypothetical protein
MASLNQFRASTQYQAQWASPQVADGIHVVRVVNTDGLPLDLDAISTPVIAPQNLVISAATQSALTLGWDDLSANESGFNIYRWSFNGVKWDFTYLDKVGVNVKTYTQSGLDCGSDLNYYQVAAYNATGESTRTAALQGITSPCSTVPNDDFNSARLAAPLAYSDSLQTIGATKALDDPQVSACNLNAGAATVWYQLVPPASGLLNLDTIGSDYDTFLALWSGPRGSLAPLACNDDRYAAGVLVDRQSELKIGVSASKVYYIEVGQYNGALAAGLGLSPDKPAVSGLSAGGALRLHASITSYSISGNVGVAGATLTYTDGVVLTVTSDSSGNYTLPISYNWSGTVTPSKAGYAFTPASRSYVNVAANRIGENYTVAIADVTPPAAISTLTATRGSGFGMANLHWTAVGDDGNTGTATSYLVRYSLTPITTETAWNAATPVTTGIPKPTLAGTGQGMVISNLSAGVTYYFMVRALDEVPNMGGLSNAASTQPNSVICNNSMLVTGLQSKSLCGEGSLSGYYGTKVYAGIMPRLSGFISKTISISFVKGGARMCFSAYRGGTIYFSANNGRTWTLVHTQPLNAPNCAYISSSGLYALAKK